MDRLRTLLPLNGHLCIAGETFFQSQLAVDMIERILFINHPLLGELRIPELCDVTMRFLDLEVPASIRSQQKDDGWETMTPWQLFDFIARYPRTRGGDE